MGVRDPRPRSTLQAIAGESVVTIRVFPHDERFVRDLERVLASLSSSTLSSPRLRSRLQASLRAWYPMFEVHRRDDLADLEPDEELWYAMRDGRIGRPRERIDRLHAVMSDARLTAAKSAEDIEHVRETVARAARPRPPAARPRSA